MPNVLIAPGKYVQGAKIINHIAEYILPLGKNVFCLINQIGMDQLSTQISKSIEAADGTVVYEVFNGECCKSEIERLCQLCKAERIDVLIAAGGGKIHDMAKAVSHYENLPVVIVPTSASTDAPCSSLSVIYSEDGVFDSYLFLKKNPDVVLVDSEVVAKAPVRLLCAGMGDALSTYYEARACSLSNALTSAGGNQTLAALSLSKLCYQTLIKQGFMAKLACQNKIVTKALEEVIEANILLSGLGFESGGLAAAHAIHNGLTILPECHHMYHGEKVAFGTIVQLILENAPKEEVMEVVNFCLSVGLPITLTELGLARISEKQIRAVAEAAAANDQPIHNMPFTVDADAVYSAIMVAHSYGNSILNKTNDCL